MLPATAINGPVLLSLWHRAMLTGSPANHLASGVGAGQWFIRYFEVTDFVIRAGFRWLVPGNPRVSHRLAGLGLQVRAGCLL